MSLHAAQEDNPVTITRSFLLLLACLACFIFAAITAEVGHAVGLQMWTWAFAGAAAYVASRIP